MFVIYEVRANEITVQDFPDGINVKDVATAVEAGHIWASEGDKLVIVVKQAGRLIGVLATRSQIVTTAKVQIPG